MSGKQLCPDRDCNSTVTPDDSYCSSCGTEIPEDYFSNETDDDKPNKRTWVMVLLVHKAHDTGKYEFTTNELQDKVNNSVSKKTIRRARDELKQMGLVEHESGDKKWYFIPNEP
jgi:hypothetical protein